MNFQGVIFIVLALVASSHSRHIEQLRDDVPPHKDDRCPQENGAQPTYLPYENNCHKYYECNAGWIYEFTCPGNLMFNPDTNVCDRPQNVDCKTELRFSSNLLEKSLKENGNPIPHWDQRCPAVNGPTPTYLPHETDCTKYYECNNRYAYEFTCPAGLFFNPVKNVCDQPKNVDCPANTKQAKAMETSLKENGNPTPHWDARCPAVNGPTPTYLPHETDCTKYYECNNRYAYEFTCPAGLFFNPVKNVCDQPKNVDCPANTKQVKAMETSLKENGNPTPHWDERCPAVNGPTPTYLPHETDCTKYYECNNRYAYEFTCPAGLFFNPVKNVCDQPKNVDCPANTKQVKAMETSLKENGNPTPHWDERCPAVNGPTPTYLPHETDCTKYYECNNRYAYEFTCPAGLFFNPVKNVCDQPKNVDCPANTKQVKAMETSLKENGNPTPHWDERCPAVNGPTPTYLPHETDCTKYYECNNRYAYEFTCPAGLFFNPVKNVCDQPKNVDCPANTKQVKAMETSLKENGNPKPQKRLRLRS